MATDYDYLSASNGSGDAALMHVNGTGRLAGATSIPVDTVTNVPAKFIGTYGTLLASGFLDPTTMRNFKGHLSGSNVIIDAFEPGAGTDLGNTPGQVVVIKPTTGWVNRVAAFIQSATATAGAIIDAAFANLTATTLTTTGNATVGGSETVNGNITIIGTSKLQTASVVTADGSGNITPTAQVFNVTALAANATIQTPSFSAADGMTGEIQIKDNGIARTLTWPAGWVVIGVTLPGTTTPGKFMYVSYRYSGADNKYHVRGVARQS